MDAFPTSVAYVINHRLEVLAANELAEALLSPLEDRRDMVRSLFYDPAARRLFAEWPAVARDAVYALRLASGREQHDPLLAGLIEELVAESPSSRRCGTTRRSVPSAASRRSSTTRTWAASS